MDTVKPTLVPTVSTTNHVDIDSWVEGDLVLYPAGVIPLVMFNRPCHVLGNPVEGVGIRVVWDVPFVDDTAGEYANCLRYRLRAYWDDYGQCFALDASPDCPPFGIESFEYILSDVDKSGFADIDVSGNCSRIPEKDIGHVLGVLATYKDERHVLERPVMLYMYFHSYPKELTTTLSFPSPCYMTREMAQNSSLWRLRDIEADTKRFPLHQVGAPWYY
ncbi:hypothetical protein [Actinotignum urinale]|uniref:Uncharacterized protein n=1 Tax=Actinotignum urinale TaxID=190146 RepID=A0ABU5G671_9ACTO|nr:hypothetical protein [Actinotignum urinale]MDY5132859.1 hypothetical protein [Actinotignum urinale]